MHLTQSETETEKNKGLNNDQPVEVAEDNERPEHSVCQHNKGRGGGRGEGQYD